MFFSCKSVFMYLSAFYTYWYIFWENTESADLTRCGKEKTYVKGQRSELALWLENIEKK